jgi:hypothetical protein
VIGRERDVRRERLAHRLAVLPALGDREHLDVLLDRVGHPVQDTRALRRRRLAPRMLSRVGGVERELDVLRVELGTSVNGSPVAGVRFSEYRPSTGATQWPPMKFS